MQLLLGPPQSCWGSLQKEGRSARECLIVLNKQGYDRPPLTGAKGTWRTIWLTFMKELAPQTPEGAYERPSYKFSFKQTQALQVVAKQLSSTCLVGNSSSAGSRSLCTCRQTLADMRCMWAMLVRGEAPLLHLHSVIDLGSAADKLLPGATEPC